MLVSIVRRLAKYTVIFYPCRLGYANTSDSHVWLNTCITPGVVFSLQRVCHEDLAQDVAI
ncbi:hypothetical protein VFPPC_17966 [Pochonia chlamydosporia 170]|uniref:Uncharacterized protein n=1 Tax=Pochonia chlamydosporia 170 TaxID=1380566 RepID=A0A219AQ45_METCM|nr:hypothetical protein VFPPC_17966 [Pochonia chlamydosporia 170]OWT42841.1 hypothetical protein VFPPC_17966 [Pochonia chlamydosporia 170]